MQNHVQVRDSALPGLGRARVPPATRSHWDWTHREPISGSSGPTDHSSERQNGNKADRRSVVSREDRDLCSCLEETQDFCLPTVKAPPTQ